MSAGDAAGDGRRARTPRHRWAYRRGEGSAFDRVAYFTDAVFAIAMTLLIVSVQAPDIPPELTGDRRELMDAMVERLDVLLPQLFSFFLAFLLLARYWLAHHAFFAVLDRVDRRFIALNLTYLAFVAFLPFPTELVGKYERDPVSVSIFALTLAAISGMESVLFRHAHRAGLLADPMSERTYRYGMIQSTTPVVLFLLSIPVAFVWSSTAALLMWVLAMPIGFIVDRRQRAEEGRDPAGVGGEKNPMAP
jgi:uncharacterized membrane protein